MTVGRRDVLKMGMAAAAASIATGLAGKTSLAAENREAGELILRAGIITDLHKTPKPDSDTRRYSASMNKLQFFMEQMERVKPAFLIELGDMVDMLLPGVDPKVNLGEIESLFTSYSGPTYHVLGNHEFDNVPREVFLKSVKNTGIPQGQTYYSWDAGGVHCIVLDADYVPGTWRPYDMNTPEDTFWDWTRTSIPPQEMDWLEKDLAGTKLPVVIFTHQTLDRVDEQDHNIKNASAVRTSLEKSGRVLTVISGHDHQGGYANIKGIHYVVLNGNVGVSDYRAWSATSSKNGYGVVEDNQYSILEIRRTGSSYTISVGGYGRQPSYILERTL